ncbi:MAG: heavy metal translocating P-type ATPase [Planctomycetes bacterium]|nr:heavy metal translocating P-type ATPase [Planctomycetota bacterium]
MSNDAPPRYCDFCGLPLTASFAFGHPRSKAALEEYCCSGCQTVASVENSKQENGAAAHQLLRLGLAVFFTMNVMVFTMALWSQDIYAAEAFATPLASSLRGVFRWASLLFSAPVLFLLGGPIARGVWSALRRRAITTDLLILLGIAAAYGYSVVSVVRDAGHVYFEVGAMVLVFVSIGRWLEAKGKLQTGESLDALARLLPAKVQRLDDQGNFAETARKEVRTGDVLRVLPGERFPVDGVLVGGQALVDEHIVTGESRYTEKTDGDTVYSGSLNVDGDVRIEVTAADGNETVSRILNLVRQARREKGYHQRLADRIATWFVPAVCVIAIVAGWLQGQEHGLDRGIMTTLAVVLISCPCALGLATPMAVWTALGRAARSGVLFRSGLVMERLATVQYACFDKTGTLTTGKPSTGELVVSVGESRDYVRETAAHLAAGSTHGLSQAIVHFQRQEISDWRPSKDIAVESLPGRGLMAEVADVGPVVLGSRRLMDENRLHWLDDLQPNATEVEPSEHQVFIGWDGKVRGAFFFAEQLRPEAAEAFDACRQLNLDLRMLTGDEQQRAIAIGNRLEIPTVSQQLPEEKAATLQSLAQQGPVAMVGDGLNDAPALATADVGVALGCGADLSRDTAGVCLLADDLRGFPWAVGLARETLRVVKQNLFWAFAYNICGIALATTGRLNPIWAALAMAISSIMVVGNSLRLGRYPELGNHSEAEESSDKLRSTINQKTESSQPRLVTTAP